MSDDEHTGGEELREEDASEDSRQGSADQGDDAAGDAGADTLTEDHPVLTVTQQDSDPEDSGQGDTGERDGSEKITHEEKSAPAAADASSEAATGSSKINSREDDDRKIFVGGLHWETTANDIKEYFSMFGTVVDCTLKTDMATGKSRGFGFVLFEDASIIDKVMEDKSHTLHGRTIDPKRAQARGTGGTGTTKAEPSRKVFVGGLSPDVPESEIREYFAQYGRIDEVELPFDKLKNQRRAFCFITYESVECVEKAVVLPKQKFGDKEVDVRKATPKSEQELANARPAGRGGYSHPGQYGQGYAPPGGYDYSGYYGQQPGYGYGAYPGYGAYDYSAYYGQDWSGYGQGYAYPGYDYSGYYSGYYDPNAQAGAAAGAAGASSASYKAKRGGAASPGGTAGYHPYSR